MPRFSTGRPTFEDVDEPDHQIWLARAGIEAHVGHMNLLSINSHVAYGHVGNSAAVFALQRLGVEVWPIYTVELSNHPGYGDFRGRPADAAAIRDLVEGIAARGALARCDGIASGYLGTAEIGVEILAAVASVKTANPAARYCCDPVIGDTDRGIYVRADVAELIRARLVPTADVVTPNPFELTYLSGGHACASLGDAIAALFFAHLVRGSSAAEALGRAASSLFGILRRTSAAGARELLLIEAQDEIVAPSVRFQPEPI
jgi:pyridoxine kinase